jgi:hypothetical protein
MDESQVESWLRALRKSGISVDNKESRRLIAMAERQNIQSQECVIHFPTAIRELCGSELRIVRFPDICGRVKHTFNIYHLTDGISTTRDKRLDCRCLVHRGGRIELDIYTRRWFEVPRCSRRIPFKPECILVPLFDCVICRRCSMRLVEPSIDGIPLDDFHNRHDEDFWKAVLPLIGRPFERFVHPDQAPQHQCDSEYGAMLLRARRRRQERKRAAKKARNRVILEDGTEAVYLYLMVNSRNGLYKLGFSTDPFRRERTLQSEEPEVSLKWKIIGLRRDESTLHKRFAHKRVRGEWFQLDQHDVAWITSVTRREDLYEDAGALADDKLER